MDETSKSVLVVGCVIAVVVLILSQFSLHGQIKMLSQEASSTIQTTKLPTTAHKTIQNPQRSAPIAIPPQNYVHSPVGVWQINGNGFVGDLIIALDENGNLVNSSVYNDPINGFWDNVLQKIVFYRTGYSLAQEQTYTGYLFYGGMAGSFEAFVGTGSNPPREMYGWFATPQQVDTRSDHDYVPHIEVPSTAKDRDGKRISDLKQLQTALELYYNDKNAYPRSILINLGNTTTACFSGSGFVPASKCVNPYMMIVPKDPLGTYYQYKSNGTTYTITKVNLETNLEGLKAGPIHLEPSGISSGTN